MGRMYIFRRMPTAIVDTNELAALVQPDKLAQEGFPRPSRVSVVLSTDHTGEEAYYVYLIFPNETPDASLKWGKIKDMMRWVHDQVWRASGEERWPYVHVKREADLFSETFGCRA